MEKNTINWDNVPDYISKEQLFKLCHISKRTALYLLESKKIPNRHSGKKTHSYQISKADVIKYVNNRTIYPDYYKTPPHWFSKNRKTFFDKTIPLIKEDQHDYYRFLLKDFPDVLTTKEISSITGYSSQTINKWCTCNAVRHFHANKKNQIPKEYLIDFFCSTYFRRIPRKSIWHTNALLKYKVWRWNNQ